MGPIHVNRLNILSDPKLNVFLFFLISGKIFKKSLDLVPVDYMYFKSDESYHLMLLGFLTICNYSLLNMRQHYMFSSIKPKLDEHLFVGLGGFFYQFLPVFTC